MHQDANFGHLSEQMLRPPTVVSTEEGGGAEEPVFQQPLMLQLKVTDPEISAALRAHAEGESRNQYALGALRLGVLALRAASGQIDTGEIRHAGQKLMSEMASLLNEHSGELTGEIAGALKQYFDPQTGLLPQRFSPSYRTMAIWRSCCALILRQDSMIGSEP